MDSHSRESKALLNEFRRAVTALSQLIRTWDEGKADRELASGQNTYLSILKKGIRTSYEYIIWIEKSAALPRLLPPPCLDKLESADLKTVVSAVNLLAPFAVESLGSLSDEQLQYRPVRDYTLEQMLEHAVVSVWLLLGQVEK